MTNIKLETGIENIAVSVYKNQISASIYVAQRIAAIITHKQSLGQFAVLGLATGNTPVLVYKELVRLHREEGLSFQNVFTFNLDEYFPMQPTDANSYVTFMHTHLFNHIDIPSKNIHIPDGTLAVHNIAPFCDTYEKRIASLGGLDLQLLGIGLTGHIGFNEPGSTFDSTTRLVTLNPLTREVAVDDFNGLENVPTHAITMGVSTIAQAKEILLLAWTQKKASIIQKALQNPISEEVPATYLQQLSNVEFVLDKEAASLL